MGRTDEKILQKLELIPEETEIQLVTIYQIARQATFVIALEPIRKVRKNITLAIVGKNETLKGVQILTRDSAWEFDMNATWAEPRYISVKDLNQRREMENNFNRIWETSKATNLRFQARKRGGEKPD